MEIRPLRETDSRMEVSRIYEESWKFAYRGIVPQAYLDGIPAGQGASTKSTAFVPPGILWSRSSAGRPSGRSCTAAGPSRLGETAGIFNKL